MGFSHLLDCAGVPQGCYELDQVSVHTILPLKTFSVFGLRSGTVWNDPNLRRNLDSAFGLVEGSTPSITGSAVHQHKRVLISFRWKRPDDTVRHHPKLLEMIPCRMSWCRTWSFHYSNTLLRHIQS